MQNIKPPFPSLTNFIFREKIGRIRRCVNFNYPPPAAILLMLSLMKLIFFFFFFHECIGVSGKIIGCAKPFIVVAYTAIYVWKAFNFNCAIFRYRCDTYEERINYGLSFAARCIFRVVPTIDSAILSKYIRDTATFAQFSKTTDRRIIDDITAFAVSSSIPTGGFFFFYFFYIYILSGEILQF